MFRSYVQFTSSLRLCRPNHTYVTYVVSPEINAFLILKQHAPPGMPLRSNKSANLSRLSLHQVKPASPNQSIFRYVVGLSKLIWFRIVCAKIVHQRCIMMGVGSGIVINRTVGNPRCILGGIMLLCILGSEENGKRPGIICYDTFCPRLALPLLDLWYT